MFELSAIRKDPGTILVLGNYEPVLQATIDFDYLAGKDAPSIIGIVTSSARFKKFFFGSKEVLIPCYRTLDDAKQALDHVDWMLNLNSGRRAHETTLAFFASFPDAHGGHIFAEDVPEIHALDLYRKLAKDKLIVGTAGVGLLLPGALKLGVIGGIDWRQLEHNSLNVAGNIAVLSASGGMINELITIVAQSGHHISFALCFGGDRFPTTTPKDAILMAEADPATESIVYYGELGGQDEYEIATLIESGEITKPLVTYIAGVIGENFTSPVQFGHAKALARTNAETASAKRTALQKAGAFSAESISDLEEKIRSLPKSTSKTAKENTIIANRRKTLFTSTIASESADGYAFAGTLLQDWAAEGDIANLITTALLGKRPQSALTSQFIKEIFLLSVDHGPQVSGALNTIIAARAGKGLADSLTAGLMTIGPRFGGAVSGAAKEWFDGVSEQRDPQTLVENYARAKKYILGIGHKKYRLGFPDPRVARLITYADKLQLHPHLDYARQIEAITSAKKGSLILNVDGTIAAIMLDILTTEEKLPANQIASMIAADFFNALFALPRVIGFTAHYLDQKRLDEGLFRLPDDDILLA